MRTILASHNLSGFGGNMGKLQHFLATTAYDIIFLQETWYTDAHNFDLNGIVTNSAFEFAVTNRSLHAGGVSTLWRNTLQLRNSKSIAHDGKFEALLCTFTIGSNILQTMNCYTPPIANPIEKANTMDALFEALETNLVPVHDTIVVGDFNMHRIKWGITGPTATNLGDLEADFLAKCDNLGLTQLNTMVNQFGNTLDLILVNNDQLINSIRISNANDRLKPDDRHHHALCFPIHYLDCKNAPRTEKTKIHLNRRKLNTILSEALTGCVFDNEESLSDASYLNTICSNLSDLVNRCTTITIVKTPNWTERHPIIKNDPVYLSLLETDSKLVRMIKLSVTTGPETNTFRLNTERDVALAALTRRYHVLEDRLRRSINEESRPQNLYKFMKSMKGRSDIPDGLFFDGRFFPKHERDIALRTALAANFAHDGLIINSHTIRSIIQDTEIVHNNIYWGHVCNDFSEGEILKAIRKLKITKDPGPMRIPAAFIKEHETFFTWLIKIMANAIIKFRKIPHHWKIAYLVPIFKKGDKKYAANYRGIALQSCMPKIFDMILTSRILSVFQDYIDPAQHGFHKTRNITTSHLETCDIITTGLIEANQVDGIYFDFSRAFDRIDHSILIKKLVQLGMTSNLVEIIMAFVANRMYQLRIDGTVSSETISPRSSIPQGSHLGPLIYLIYCNDIAGQIRTVAPRVNIMQYADDTKILLKIRTHEDVREIQTAINAIADWSTNNKIPINAGKTTAISFISTNRGYVPSAYYINGVPIQKQHEIKDLGLVYDQSLSFNAHARQSVTNTPRAIGMGKRIAWRLRDPAINMKLFRIYYLPKLEFANIIWAGSTTTRLQLMETQLRAATRAAIPGNYMTYEQRLQHLNFTKISGRITKQRILTGVKIWRQQFVSIIREKMVAHWSPTINRIGSRSWFNTARIPHKPSNPITLMLKAINSTAHVFDLENDSIYTIKRKLTEHFREAAPI